MIGNCEREIQVEYIYKQNLKDEMCAVVTSRNVNKCLHAFFIINAIPETSNPCCFDSFYM